MTVQVVFVAGLHWRGEEQGAGVRRKRRRRPGEEDRVRKEKLNLLENSEDGMKRK